MTSAAKTVARPSPVEIGQPEVQHCVANAPLGGNAAFGIAGLCLIDIASTRCGIQHIAAFHSSPKAQAVWEAISKVISTLDPDRLEESQNKFLAWAEKTTPRQVKTIQHDIDIGTSFLSSSVRLKRIAKIFAANKASFTRLDMGHSKEFAAFLDIQKGMKVVPHVVFLSSHVHSKSEGANFHLCDQPSDGRYREFERSLSLIPKNAIVVDLLPDDKKGISTFRYHLSSRDGLLPRPSRCLLERALEADDYDESIYYIKRGADPHHKDPSGCTYLASMAERDNLNAMRALLDGGVDVNDANTDQATALHAAAAGNCIHSIALLASHGADLDVRESISKMTPLHQAASLGHLAAVKVLVRLGAKRFVKDHLGFTALRLTHCREAPVYKLHGTPIYKAIQEVLEFGLPIIPSMKKEEGKDQKAKA